MIISVFLMGQCFIVEAPTSLPEPSFFSISCQKNTNKVLSASGSPFSKKKIKPHPLWCVCTVQVLQNLTDNHYIQICQLEKDKQMAEEKSFFFFFLSAVSTVRQTKSTVWIIHVLV